jgi:hypothetical protein
MRERLMHVTNNILKKRVLKAMDELEHSVRDGFYDKTWDMFFRDLDEWMQFHGYKWSDIL